MGRDPGPPFISISPGPLPKKLSSTPPQPLRPAIAFNFRITTARFCVTRWPTNPIRLRRPPIRPVMPPIDATTLAESMVRMYGLATAFKLADHYGRECTESGDSAGHSQWAGVAHMLGERIETEKKFGNFYSRRAEFEKSAEDCNLLNPAYPQSF